MSKKYDIQICSVLRTKRKKNHHWRSYHVISNGYGNANEIKLIALKVEMKCFMSYAH